MLKIVNDDNEWRWKIFAEAYDIDTNLSLIAHAVYDMEQKEIFVSLVEGFRHNEAVFKELIEAIGKMENEMKDYLEAYGSEDECDDNDYYVYEEENDDDIDSDNWRETW